MQILSGHKGCVRDVSWHPYNPEILSSSWDFTVRRWTASDSSSERSSRASDKQEEMGPGGEKKRRLDLTED